MYTAPFYTDYQLENLDPSQISYPYSDRWAVYRGDKHQYELTRAYFEERGHNLEVELDGDSPDKIQNFLAYLRTKTYNYIYTHCKSSRNQLNYLIAKRGLRTYPINEFRETFLEAMYLEGCYLIDNGDLSAITGVDLDTMQNMSADVMRNQDRDWHKEAVALLKSLGLVYFGRYSFYPQGKEW